MSESQSISRRSLLKFAVAKTGEHIFGPVKTVDWAPTDHTPELARTFISQIVIEPPLIGTNKHAKQELDYGIGWATFHLTESSPIMHKVITNRLIDAKNPNHTSPNDINILALENKKLTDFLIESQGQLSPTEAFNSDQYIGYLATRGANDIGKKYAVFTQDSPESPVKFIGVSLCVDNSGNNGNLYKPYGLDGWNTAGYQRRPLEWICDASAELIKKLPLGRAPSKEALMNGRPGVILVSESKYISVMQSAS